MDPKTIVGQVHLTHPKDTNFTSLYEESFSKHGQNIQLFGVLEIAGSAGPLARGRKLAEGTLAELRTTGTVEGESLEEVFLRLTEEGAGETVSLPNG